MLTLNKGFPFTNKNVDWIIIISNTAKAAEIFIFIVISAKFVAELKIRNRISASRMFAAKNWITSEWVKEKIESNRWLNTMVFFYSLHFHTCFSLHIYHICIQYSCEHLNMYCMSLFDCQTWTMNNSAFQTMNVYQWKCNEYHSTFLLLDTFLSVE